MTDIENSTQEGAVTGKVGTLLRIEGLMLFCAATLFYGTSGASWWLFAVLFLAPDLSFLAYLAGPRLGAIGYNAFHATIGPLLLGLGSMIMHWSLAGSLALIWLAHIGIDRALGYGLKYASGFGFTHLGRIGPAARS
jgi:uncharacterized membrane protein YbjE (DUF340 family)